MPSKVHFSVDNNDKRTLPADLCLSTFCDREPFITCYKKIQAIYSSSRRAFLDADAGNSGGDHNAGLHKLWYPGIRDTSTWSKFGAHGEHGDVFLFSNLGAL